MKLAAVLPTAIRFQGRQLVRCMAFNLCLLLLSLASSPCCGAQCGA